MSNKANKIIIGSTIYNIEDTDARKMKADKDGYYPKLTSGHSDNLVGRGESTESIFTYRISDGSRSIDDGVAKVEKIKGNTVVWNQLAGTDNIIRNNATIEKIDDKTIKVISTKDYSADIYYFGIGFRIGEALPEYKYIITYDIKENPTGLTIAIGPAKTSSNKILKFVNKTTAIFINANYSSANPVEFKTGDYFIVSNIQIYNLTLMFGAGNEPTTFDEFKSYFPNTNFPYNPGELVPLKTEKIKTVGFNIFDKRTATLGALSYKKVFSNTIADMGTIHVNNYYISDYIKIVPGKNYYFKDVVGGYYWTSIQGYDYEKNCIMYKISENPKEGIYNSNFFYDFSGQPEIIYIRICCHKNYLDSCCVNLVHTGYKNGTYENYEDYTRPLDFISKYFPDGMKKAGNVCDELTSTYAVKRIGVIEDMSTLNWISSQAASSVGIRFGVVKLDYINPTKSSNQLGNLICDLYPNVTAVNTWDGVIGLGIDNSSNLYIYDNSCTTVQELKSKLSGHKLYYELKEPEVTYISEPLNLDYKVWDFGTEEAISSELSAPFKADTIYGFNAVDTIRNNEASIEEVRKDFIERLMINLGCETYTELSDKISQLLNLVETIKIEYNEDIK